MDNRQTLSADFFLSLGASLAGTVMGNGSLLTNAFVALTDSSGNLTGAVTDTKGDFTASGLKAGAYTVEVEAAGYAPFTTPINLTGGATNSLGTVTLIPGGTITATADTTSSQAVSNALLTLTQNGNIIGQLFTDSNGQALFPDLASGTYELISSAYGYQGSTNSVTVSVGGQVASSFTMGALGSIVGRVTDGSGTPIPNMEVNVSGIGSRAEGISFAVQTDAQGNYSLLGLPAGPYEVTIGNNPGIDAQSVTIPASLIQQTVNFTFGASLVQGQVLAADNRTPVGFASVALSQGAELLASATTDTNGFYTFRVLLPGAYTLAAGSKDGISPSVPISVPVAGSLVVPTLVLGSLQLSGSVTDSNGNLLTNAAVELTPPSGTVAPLTFFYIPASTNGQFTFTGLFPGQYELEINQPGYGQFSQVITLATNTNQLCVLPVGIPVHGVITDATTGEPVTNGLVSFFDPTTHFLLVSTSSDSSGTFSTLLAAGGYDVLLSEVNHQTVEMADVTAETNPLVLNVSLPAQNTLVQGAAADTSGNPIAQALIFIVDSLGETPIVLTTADDGSWSTAQLPPGNYTMSLQALGYLPPSVGTISVAAGLPQTVNLTFTPAATDDDSQTAQNYYYLAQVLGQGLAAYNCHQPPPEEQFTRSIDRPLCPCAFQASQSAKRALDRATEFLNGAYDDWSLAYANSKAYAGADTAIGTTDLAKTIVDAYAAFGPFGKAEAALNGFWSGTTRAGQAQAIVAQALTIGAQIKLAVDAANNARQNATPVSVATTFFAVLGASGNIGTSIGNFLSALQGLPGLQPGSPLAVIGDAYKNVQDAIRLWKDWKESLNTCQRTSIDFNERLAQYEAAWFNYTVAVNSANADCGNCPTNGGGPPPPPPPPPPNPNPVNPNPSPIPPGGSTDPNDKFTTGFGNPAFVRPGGAITYTILFENQPTASLPAQAVAISDLLSSNLDWSTLQLGAIGFNNVSIPIPGGVQTFATMASVTTDPNPVQVNASLDPTNGTVTWVMQSINPVTRQLVTDPLAGFLPPDNVEQAGEGYVTYTVQARAGLPTGTQIANQASIVFDVNAPIATPITTNTIDGTGPVSAMTPLPATTMQTNLLVAWSGSDVGSGIQAYDIYLSVHGGAWTPWLQGTTNTSALFQAAYGNSYAFYSVATDGVGNRETSPHIPGTQTTVGSSQTPLLASPSFINGQFRFTLLGAAGTNYVVQTSTNFVHWVPVVTNVAPFVFIDFTPMSSPWRWYRAVQAP